MARRKYVKGALVEARNSKWGKGFGIIIGDPTIHHTTVHGYHNEKGLEYFDVQWFKCPHNIDNWTFNHRNGRFCMSKNQIKVLKKS